MSGDEYMPYYYGLNYEASEGAPKAQQAPLGTLWGDVLRQDQIGADQGLWYSHMTGMPLDPKRFEIGYGENTEPPVLDEVVSKWMSGKNEYDRKMFKIHFGDMDSDEIEKELLR